MLTQKEIINEQCRYCKHFAPDLVECHFAIEYGWGEHDNIEWFRDNDPDAIALTQDCLVFPATKLDPEPVPEFNQQ